MRSVKVLDAINALDKIQVLAAAAGYLTSSEKEEQLCFELIELIEETARRGVEAENE
ncbi:hypothetical protein [Serratia rubidaea]|uniref:Relaxosome protein TraM n=1 Tax=Serratia rubidaea TaxID=61652 RepID=A0ABS0MEV0_SERRU|nr:hypothetical protein [Serratia rubidaea]MBH1930900.1 hypothetical protein [Serratia rubidaea]